MKKHHTNVRKFAVLKTSESYGLYKFKRVVWEKWLLLPGPFLTKIGFLARFGKKTLKRRDKPDKFERFSFCDRNVLAHTFLGDLDSE